MNLKIWYDKYNKIKKEDAITLKMNNEEKLISFLNEEFSKSKTNKVSICKSDIPTIGLSEQQITQSLSLMDEKYIKILNKSVHDDLSAPWSIMLDDSCVYYFVNKKSNRNQLILTILKEFRAWGTLAIAILSLILAA